MLNHRRCNHCEPHSFARLGLVDRRKWPSKGLTVSQWRDVDMEASIQMKRVDKVLFDTELRKDMSVRVVNRNFVTYQRVDEDWWKREN
jgi:hypothetical protein